MRFKDYIVNQAIERNYKDYVLLQNDNTVIDSIYSSLAKKLGFTMVDEIEVSSIKVNNKWKNILSRYSYDKDLNPKRFLDYDTSNRRSIYFGENGKLFIGNGATFKDLDENDDYYKKYNDFLNFAKKYFIENKKSKKQFLLIGYDDKHFYYLGNDLKYYYKIGHNSNYNLCSDRLNKICQEMTKNFCE